MTRTCSIMPNMMGLELRAPPGGSSIYNIEKRHNGTAYEHYMTPQSGRDCANDFAIKAFEYRNAFDAIG